MLASSRLEPLPLGIQFASPVVLMQRLPYTMCPPRKGSPQCVGYSSPWNLAFGDFGPALWVGLRPPTLKRASLLDRNAKEWRCR
jgi:hypothetical protein